MNCTDLKLNDRVKISSTSQYYRDGGPSNPKDVEGTVIEECPLRVRVQWDELGTNYYYDGDLELINIYYEIY